MFASVFLHPLRFIVAICTEVLGPLIHVFKIDMILDIDLTIYDYSMILISIIFATCQDCWKVVFFACIMFLFNQMWLWMCVCVINFTDLIRTVTFPECIQLKTFIFMSATRQVKSKCQQWTVSRQRVSWPDAAPLNPDPFTPSQISSGDAKNLGQIQIEKGWWKIWYAGFTCVCCIPWYFVIRWVCFL